MEDCRKFKSASYDDRVELVSVFSRCIRCLKYHRSSICGSTDTCQVKGCSGAHHTMLHRPGSEQSKIEAKKSTSIARCTPLTPQAVNVCGTPVQVLLGIVPVTLVNGNRSYSTYAFLDGGSQITMIKDSAAKKLNLDGPREPLTVQWWQGSLKKFDARLVDFRANAADGSDGVDIEQAYVVRHLEASDQRVLVNQVEMEAKWPHTKGIQIPFVDADKVEVLIGQDTIEAHRQLEEILPTKDGPYAFRSRFGWYLAGKTKRRQAKGEPTVKRSHSVRVARDDHRLLQDQMEQLWSVEAAGTMPDVKLPMNDEAASGLRILQEGT